MSIIIPVYNVSDFLEECIESIITQDVDSEVYEIVLVNDGSTDNSEEVCRKLSDKCYNIKFITQKNQGQSSARNKGVSLAKGKYIYFIDSDDFLLKKSFSLIFNRIIKGDLDFIGFEYERAKTRFKGLKDDLKLNLKCKGSGLNILKEYNYNNGPCWYIIKKELLNNLKFEENRLCEDGLFTTELLLKVQKGEIYSNKIYGYYVNPNSTVNNSNDKRLRKMNEDMFFAATKFSQFINKLNTEDKLNKGVFFRLKDRQESYTFFAIVRFLKSRRRYKEVKPFLKELKNLDYPAYPIKVFDGYKIKKNQLLIELFNSKTCLYFMIKINRILKFIK
ncbi:glycosyltransferase family 2 protein [Tenacibaculum crassostreae]|uniref:glycosyltransferase family 2 protein n=1 Tax=Tenacibaculum crassostreae TaxID=502683 RepID=UPI0038B69DD0